MKVTKLFFRVTLLLFPVLLACSDSDDPGSSSSSGACQLTKYLSGSSAYIFTYNSAGRISESIHSYGSSQYKYKLEYTSDQVKLFSGDNSNPPVYTLTETNTINSNGLPVSKKDSNGNITLRYVYNGSQLSYYVEYYYNTGISIAGGPKDSIVVTYDAAGKNILKVKNHKYSYDTQSWIAGTIDEYEYDNKINPFNKLWGADGNGNYEPLFFSQNNITSDSENDVNAIYTYNDQNYPVLRTESGTKTQTEAYEYLCK